MDLLEEAGCAGLCTLRLGFSGGLWGYMEAAEFTDQLSECQLPSKDPVSRSCSMFV